MSGSRCLLDGCADSLDFEPRHEMFFEQATYTLASKRFEGTVVEVRAYSLSR
jgi:hypothetical protein